MIDRRIAFAAGCTLALLAARLSAQEACSVALVYPQETVFLQSDSCQSGWICQPGNCYSGRLYLSEPVTLSNTIFNVSWADYGSADSVSILTAYPEAQTVVLSWTGHLYWNGSSWVLDIPNAIFSGGFDQ